MMWKITGQIGNQGHNVSFLVEAAHAQEAETLGIEGLNSMAMGEEFSVVSVAPEPVEWRGGVYLPETVATPSDWKGRTFESGAIRDTDQGKLDYEGCLNPEVLEVFAQYMLKHSYLPDGSRRSMDNWQKGFPQDQTVKSLLRHVWAVWLSHRRGEELKEDDLCGVLFNAQALMLSLIKDTSKTEGLSYEDFARLSRKNFGESKREGS